MSGELDRLSKLNRGHIHVEMKQCKKMAKVLPYSHIFRQQEGFATVWKKCIEKKDIRRAMKKFNIILAFFLFRMPIIISSSCFLYVATTHSSHSFIKQRESIREMFIAKFLFLMQGCTSIPNSFFSIIIINIIFILNSSITFIYVFCVYVCECVSRFRIKIQLVMFFCEEMQGTWQ